MLTQEAIEAFKAEGFTFEEIQSIQESLKNFEETGVSYSMEEVANYIDNELFAKYKVPCIK